MDSFQNNLDLINQNIAIAEYAVAANTLAALDSKDAAINF